jgi:hypothetical protein
MMKNLIFIELRHDTNDPYPRRVGSEIGLYELLNGFAFHRHVRKA